MTLKFELLYSLILYGIKIDDLLHRDALLHGKNASPEHIINCIQEWAWMRVKINKSVYIYNSGLMNFLKDII